MPTGKKQQRTFSHRRANDEFFKEDLHGFPIILYGAGRRAAKSIQSLAANGISPVCFCDSDPHKWDTRYLELPIMSIERAKEQYGDFYLYITPALPTSFEIYRQLTEENCFPHNRILHDDDVIHKKYVSCSQLESDMAVWGNFGLLL